MKLVRFGAVGAEKPGVMLADGTLVDASSFGPASALVALRKTIGSAGREAPLSRA